MQRLARRLLAPLLVAAVTATLLACGSSEPPAVDHATHRGIAQGELVGFVSEDTHVWRGIPFAEAPVGALRWRPPIEPRAWTGVRETTTHGAECPQLSPSGDFTGDEDCLTLDIYAPADAIQQPRPVMVFIHGGGNTLGSSRVYDGARLARENGVIVVTVQYRLGILGWFAHSALRATETTPEGLSGNWGTLDLIRSLEWVRDNIAAFGGDPGRVTIFGESAGGVNVFSLLLSPRARGLFHGAISQSGFVTSFPMAEAENASDAEPAGISGSSTDVALSLLELDGRAASRDEARAALAAMSAAETAKWLRGKPVADLFAPFQQGETMGGMYFAPFVFRDGHVVVDADPLEALQVGLHNPVPTIMGTNRDEQKLFLAMASPYVNRLGPIPTGINSPERYEVLAEYGARLWKAAGADQPATAMQTTQEAPVFGYRFDWDEEPSILGIDLAQLIGAGHAVELLFVFGGTDSTLATRLLVDDVPSAERLSKEMRSYWGEFAATGNPGRGQQGDLPAWPGWAAESPQFLVFDSVRDAGLHLSGETETEAGVIAAVANDTRLTDIDLRCEVYAGFVQWSTSMSPEQYTRINDGECAAHPLESRTPFD